MDDILTDIEHPVETSHSTSVKYEEKPDFPFERTREKLTDLANRFNTSFQIFFLY